MILAVLAAATVAAAPPTCPGDNTPEINRCAEGRLDQTDDTLARYVAAARKRLKDDSASAATLTAFDKAEVSFGAYREAECEAVYQDWIEGTIRTLMDINCRIDLTVRHTHVVWANWLTYMDSTPPILPEPPDAPPQP